MRVARLLALSAIREGLFQAAEGGTLFLDEIWRYARTVAGQTAARVAGA
ncbi:Uncharacterised protein [Escherichia coli]|uniref:Sigma-54 factor interaction domain-containing protein n=1 Tax=Escherichia coli TaxID=562 RepID=A0A376LAC5_ECOLX|nr:Uncharacterised protein [Escherichia coli]